MKTKKELILEIRAEIPRIKTNFLMRMKKEDLEKALMIVNNLLSFGKDVERLLKKDEIK